MILVTVSESQSGQRTWTGTQAGSHCLRLTGIYIQFFVSSLEMVCSALVALTVIYIKFG